METTRTASASWTDGLKNGKGQVSVDSGVIAGAPITFGSRFEDAKGTNPEELIAAAHAACFSMALAAQMSELGHSPESIRTNAHVRMESAEDGGYAITQVELNTKAKADGITSDEFQALAQQAGETCPISKLIGPGVGEIIVNATLV